MKRRGFFKSLAAIPAIAHLNVSEAKAMPQYMDGNINAGNRRIDGIMPLEGEFVSGYRNDGPLGLFICEAQYRGGTFYTKDYSTGEYSVPEKLQSWNLDGLTFVGTGCVDCTKILPQK